MHSCYQIPAAKPPIRCGGAAQVGVAIATDGCCEIGGAYARIVGDEAQSGGRPWTVRVQARQALSQRRHRVIVEFALPQLDSRVGADEPHVDPIDVAGRTAVECAQELDAVDETGAPRVVVGDRVAGHVVDPIDAEKAGAGV